VDVWEGFDACGGGGADEMAKCTERSELLHLLHASAPPWSASLARDEPVCAFDISWEALEISYAKGGEVCCACRPAPPLCNSYLHCIWLSDTQRVLLDSTALFALYPASSVFALYPARPLLVRAHAPRLERLGPMRNHLISQLLTAQARCTQGLEADAFARFAHTSVLLETEDAHQCRLVLFGSAAL
jgi:hypothetical protein